MSLASVRRNEIACKILVQLVRFIGMGARPQNVPRGYTGLSFIYNYGYYNKPLGFLVLF